MFRAQLRTQYWNDLNCPQLYALRYLVSHASEKYSTHHIITQVPQNTCNRLINRNINIFNVLSLIITDEIICFLYLNQNNFD